jgi:proteasome lid subunit RPN8/RPN11
LSGDEITFGEMKLREPERRHRPDRDRRFATLAYEVPGPADLPIFLDRLAADAIERHALTDTAVELGGILLGKECLDPTTREPFVWITQHLEAKHYANTQASFTYTHESWAEITRERDLKFPQYDIVGWYHTHPSFGIFLSHHDLFIHQNFFAQPLQVAYVVDPINQTRGFFQWRDRGMAQVAGYYVTAARADRVALARLINDLEKLPNPEGNSGGTISPRLEAELIKMLSRPTQRDVIQPAERLQIAGIFGVLGMLLGALGVAAVLWLNQFQGRIREQHQVLQGQILEQHEQLEGKFVEQGEAIQKLAHQVEQSADSQRLVSEMLTARAKIDDPAEFNARYARVAADRDDVRRQLEIALHRLENQRSMTQRAEERSEDLESKRKKDVEELEATKKSLVAYREVATDSEPEELREKIAHLEQSKKDHDRWLKSDDGTKMIATQKELDRTRYYAWAGWGCTVFLGLALATSYFYQKSSTGTDHQDGPDPGSQDVERPTHRIE